MCLFVGCWEELLSFKLPLFILFHQTNKFVALCVCACVLVGWKYGKVFHHFHNSKKKAAAHTYKTKLCTATPNLWSSSNKFTLKRVGSLCKMLKWAERWAGLGRQRHASVREISGNKTTGNGLLFGTRLSCKLLDVQSAHVRCCV